MRFLTILVLAFPMAVLPAVGYEVAPLNNARAREYRLDTTFYKKCAWVQDILIVTSTIGVNAAFSPGKADAPPWSSRKKMCRDVLGDTPWRFVSVRERAGTGHLKGFDPTTAPTVVELEHIQRAAYDYYDRYWSDYWQRLRDKELRR